ncbi:MAG: flagellar hook-length control protein FliK [Methylococcales bacterium]
MNIGNSNVLSTPSPAEGLETIPPLSAEKGGESPEFSATLMQKVAQLQGQSIARDKLNAATIEPLNEGSQLHGIADFIPANESINDTSGKGLPQQKSLEKNIDLKNTLETLANVLTTLNEGGVNNIGIPAQIDASIETVKSIKQQTPEQPEITQQLDQIADSLEKLKLLYSDTVQNNESNMFPVEQGLEASATDDSKLFGSVNPAGITQTVNEGKDLIPQGSTEDLKETLLGSVDKEMTELNQGELKQLDHIIEKVDKLKSKLQDPLESDGSQGADTVGQIGETGLISDIKQLAIDIKAIKDNILDKTTVSINTQDQAQPLLGDELDQAAGIEKITSLISSLNEAKPIDRVGEQAVYQELKVTTNKENLTLKQLLARQNQSVDLSVKSEGESDLLLQQSNVVTKDKQAGIDSLFINKEGDNALQSKGVELELTADKVLPKFATDIANLNRAVISDNKAEIPAMSKHFAHPEWNQEMGEKVIWMYKQAIPSAELRLNPGHLGPITIKIDVTQDQATVAFTAQHAAVKEAIDAALPRLREMFSAQQLNLADVSVSQDDAGQKQQRGFNQMGSDAGKEGGRPNQMAEQEQQEGVMDIADEIESGRAIASSGLLSLFA